MLLKKVNDDELRIVRRVDSAVENGITNVMAQIRTVNDCHTRERLEAFHSQLLGFIADCKSDQIKIEQEIKEQSNYQMELACRDIRREIVDLGARVEGTQTLLDESLDVKRRVSDLEGGLEGVGRRIDIVNSDILQRSSLVQGLKARIESVESDVQSNRSATLLAVEDLRSDLDSKMGASDGARLELRVEAMNGEMRVLKSSTSKVEAQVNEMKSLYYSVQDLSQRLTNAMADLENTTVGTGAEIGGVKGKLDALTTRVTAIDLRGQEFQRSTQGQMNDMLVSLQTHSATITANRCMSLEAKWSQKVEGMMGEMKQWKNDALQLINTVEEKVDTQEQEVEKLSSHIEGVVLEKLIQNNNDVREISRKVDAHLCERKEHTHEMRRELSSVQEIVSGLQHQYDALLSDSLQKNDNWSDISRDLRLRLERCEHQQSGFASIFDTTLDELRQRAEALCAETTAQTSVQLDGISAEIRKVAAQAHVIEEDCRITAKGLNQLDDRIHQEFREDRELVLKISGDIQQVRTKCDTIEARQQNDGVRMAKAVLDLDVQLNQHIRDLRDQLAANEHEYHSVKRTLSTLETKSLLPSVTRTQDISLELSNIRDEFGANADRVIGQHQRLETQANRLELQLQQTDTFSRALQAAVEELRAATSQSIQELQTSHSELNLCVSSAVAKFDPSIKRFDSQMNQLSKQIKDIASSEEKLQFAIGDLQTDLSLLHSETSSLTSRIDTVTVKPLATESALRNVQNDLLANLTRVSQDMTNLQQLFHEMHDKFIADAGGKTKSLASAILQLQHKTETSENTFREYQTTVTAFLDDLRVTFDERFSSLNNKIENSAKDMNGLRQANITVQGKLKDAISRDLAQLQSKVEDKFAKWDDKILVDVESCKAAVNAVRSGLEENRKLLNANHLAQSEFDSHRSSSLKAIADLKAQFEPVVHDVMVAKNSVENMRSLLEEYRKLMLQISAKQDTVDNFTKFGVEQVKDVQKQYDHLSDDFAIRQETIRADVDKQIRNICDRYESRLRTIQDKAEQMLLLNNNVANEMKAKDTDIRNLLQNVEREVSSIKDRALSPLPFNRASNVSIADTELSSLSGLTSFTCAKPAVGLDCFESDQGVTVTFVKSLGPAASAGVAPGDIILAVDGIPVQTRAAYKSIITYKQPGDTVSHTINRAGSRITVALTLGTARPKK